MWTSPSIDGMRLTLNGSNSSGAASTRGFGEATDAERFDEGSIPRQGRNTFRDVRETDWFHGAVEYVREKGLMAGTGDDLFNPGHGVTRGTAVTVLWRMAGEPISKNNGTFSDIAQDRYKDAVAWAYENRIVDGYGDGLFGPEDDITREQLVTMLYRYIQYSGGGFEGVCDYLPDFADGRSVAGWAHESVCYCVMNGIVNGRGGRLFEPKEASTRAELAVLLHRFSNMRDKENSK